MAFLKTTIVSGNLFVTGANEYVSASEFRGPLTGTASYATSASRAVSASIADNLDPNVSLNVAELHVSGNAQVDGDLKVLGNLTYVGVQDLRVKDHLIELNVDESGSASAAADGGGIVLRNSEAAGDIELIYSASDDKLHINKQIAGTVDNADNATSASRATSAAEADKVANGLTLELTGSNGAASTDVFDGSSAKTFSVDLSTFETKTHASASVADLQDQIDAITGGGSTGSIDSKIEAKIAELDADASASAAGTAVSGGVFVLSGVAFNEADGKLTSGSATSVEVEKAGEAAKAKAELLGTNADSKDANTIYGAKAYTDDKIASASAELAVSAAGDNDLISAAVDASDNKKINVAATAQLKSDVSASRTALQEIESSSYIAVSAKANNKQTVSAKTQQVSTADATTANGLALAADVKDYVDGQVSSKNVDAEGDAWVGASASNNKVTVTTNVKAIAEATDSADGLASAYDVKSHVSASVAALSSSIATSDSASNARLAAVEATASANSSSIADLQAADATFVTTASFNSYTASQAQVDATQSARLDALEGATGSYVAKSGDTMTGALNMGNNGIQMGDMIMRWNAEDNAIEFVPAN